MPVDLTAILPHLPAWLLVLFRLSGIFFFAPMFGSQIIPRQVKVLLILGLSFCIYPLLLEPTQQSAIYINSVIDAPLSLYYLVPIIAVELLIGFVIGFVCNLPLIGMQVGGQVIDQQMGLGFAQVYNAETGGQASLMSNILFQLALIIFLILGGERIILNALVNSFNHIPLGGFTGFTAVVNIIFGVLTIAFELAIQIAAPIICLMFLVTFAMGFINRTMPQFNILSVGFSIRILVSALILIVIIPTMGSTFISVCRQIFYHLAQFVGM
ncbi:flagellar biosynthetic protein FliR [Planctomycetota bacterium]|nr:flagellar biosynthetic protein FliR [Planctomycetota bacterium]